MLSKSAIHFEEAKKFIPGGVNSPVRAMKMVRNSPLFIERGQGSKIYDSDGNSYIDYVCSWGPLILGHAHPKIVQTICEVAQKGTSFGAPTVLETELARLITTALPAVEMVRMVNSGTEAAMSALRLARGYTKRPKVVKFAGCYHGHCDSFLIKAGSGAATLGSPDSPGVTEGTAKDTLILPYNNLAAVKEVFECLGEEIAALVVEPVAGNMGLVLPKPEFLEGLRALTSEYGALLIFDEVITGFRVGYGGAQGHFGLTPDLTILGKIIGGGLPVGAYGGRQKIMEQISPSGPVYQAGTLAGNPLAMAVGVETLKLAREQGFYEKLEQKARLLTSRLTQAAKQSGISWQSTTIGSMFGFFFSEQPVTDFESVLSLDREAYRTFFNTMLGEGIYFAPSPFETAFVSAAHTDEDLEKTVSAAQKAFNIIAAASA